MIKSALFLNSFSTDHGKYQNEGYLHTKYRFLPTAKTTGAEMAFVACCQRSGVVKVTRQLIMCSEWTWSN